MVWEVPNNMITCTNFDHTLNINRAHFSWISHSAASSVHRKVISLELKLDKG